MGTTLPWCTIPLKRLALCWWPAGWKQFPEKALVICPFNATHHMSKHEERNHMLNCPDRRIVDIQVWPLLILLFPFCERVFSSIPPSNSLSPSRTLEFWADTALCKGPQLTSCVASGITEEQGHRQVCCDKHRGPRTLSNTAGANLDRAFVENALFDMNPWLWKVNKI